MARVSRATSGASCSTSMAARTSVDRAPRQHCQDRRDRPRPCWRAPSRHGAPVEIARGWPPAPARPGARASAGSSWLEKRASWYSVASVADRARIDVERVQEAHHELGGGLRGQPWDPDLRGRLLEEHPAARRCRCVRRTRPAPRRTAHGPGRIASRPASTTGSGSRSSTSCLSGSSRASRSTTRRTETDDEPEPEEQQCEEEAGPGASHRGRWPSRRRAACRVPSRRAPRSGVRRRPASVRRCVALVGRSPITPSGPVVAASTMHESDAQRRHHDDDGAAAARTHPATVASSPRCGHRSAARHRAVRREPRPAPPR